MTQAELVSGDYFSTLGVRAACGRLITRDDDRVPGGHPVVVISHGYWLRRFAGDAAIVGRTVTISQQPMTISGVTAPGFHGMNLASSTQVFVPVTMVAQIMPTAASAEWRVALAEGVRAAESGRDARARAGEPRAAPPIPPRAGCRRRAVRARDDGGQGSLPS
jgi:hypothetical protein